MLSQAKTATTLIILSLLALPGAQFAAAQTSLEDVVGEGTLPGALPGETAPACEGREDACEGVEDTLADVPGIHVDAADTPHTIEDIRHPAEDHLLAGLCVEESEACTAAMTESVTLVTPESGDAHKPGDSILVKWETPVALNPGGLLYKAEVKSAEPGSAWQPLPAASCTQDPESPTMVGGTCQTTWTAGSAGSYSFRVINTGTPLNDQFCALGRNCDIVTGVLVDGQTPTLSNLRIDPIHLKDGLVKHAVILVFVDASDDLGFEHVTITAERLDRAGRAPVSCNAMSGSCHLNLTDMLDADVYGSLFGDIRLTATATDLVGNVADPISKSHTVDTTGPALAVVTPVGGIPGVAPDGERVSLTYEVKFATPAAVRGQPVANAAFALYDGETSVCARTVPASGVVACQINGTATTKTLRAEVLPTETYDAVAHVASITWTSLSIERLNADDLPRTSLHANPGETYEAAFLVTTTHDGEPVTGAVVGLGGESYETTDSLGFVRVPVMREATEVVDFGLDATYQILEGVGANVTLTWTTITLANLTAADVFSNVADVVGFTAVATYAHNATQVVESATFELAAAGDDDCSLQGTVVNGSLTGTASCADVFSGELPVSIVESTRGITTFTSAVELPGTWTKIEVAKTYDAFVDVGATVRVTGTAVYAHNQAPVPNATFGWSGPVPAGCTLGEGAGITGGILAANLTCTEVHTAPLALVVTGGHEDVVLLAENFVVNATWTEIVVSNLALDNFVNVHDVVTLTGVATYAHGGNVPSAAIAFGDGAPGACSLLSGSVSDGALKVEVTCGDVIVADIPLVVASAHEDVTLLADPLALEATWTEIVVTGLSTNEWTLGDMTWAASPGRAYGQSLLLEIDDDTAFGYVSTRAIAPGTKIGDLEALSFAAFYETGGCGGGSPRLQLGIDRDGDGIRDGNVFVYGGPAPSYTGCATGAWETYDLLSGARFDASQIGGAYSSTQAQADAAAGATHQIVSATLAWDSSWMSGLESSRIYFDDLTVGTLELVEPEFLNVGEAVTLTASARWAHDTSIKVPSARVALVDGTSGSCTLGSDQITVGILTAVVTCDVVHTPDIFFTVTEASENVTNLSRAIPLEAIWTQIVVANCVDEDDFVNKGDLVKMGCDVSYAHDDSPVRSATLELGEGAHESCTIAETSGTSGDGNLFAGVTCNTVAGDLAVPLVVASAFDDVTLLAQPLSLDATWTQIVLTYETDHAGLMLAPNAPVVFTATMRYAHDSSLVAGGVVNVASPDGEEFVCLTGGVSRDGINYGGTQGVCNIEVSKNLGTHTFTVTGFAGKEDGSGFIDQDITSVENVLDTTTYRWTAIAFKDLVCKTGTGSLHACGSQTYAKGTRVTVYATAVAADDETETPLYGATIRLGGTDLTDGANETEDGTVSNSFVRFTAGSVTITARGMSATIGGETVTATIPETQTITFV